jgi:hypothetical protein
VGVVSRIAFARSQRGWELSPFGSLETHLFQVLPQFIEAPFADKTDGTRREFQILGDLQVGSRRGLEKQHLYQPLASRGQVRHGFAQELILLRFENQPIRRFSGFQQFVFTDFLRGLTLGFAFPMKAFVSRDLNEPPGQRFGFP